MKKKINEIVESQQGGSARGKEDKRQVSHPAVISKSSLEVEFFRLLKNELKKSSDFFSSTESWYQTRRDRVKLAYEMLMRSKKDGGVEYDNDAWSRVLVTCVRFYKDVLLLENFAIMNYCGFSKILKKHDKLTG